MKKIVLVDGNNLLFRSYYATAYTGNIMRNSKGFPTNGLYGFVNMLNKIISDEKPEYMMVAFDIGKTFRHDEYEDYKGGRNATPDDLKCQFPVAKEILNAMNIKYLELDGYEADDIIGTFARMVDEDSNYEGLIVSSDKDLLQLISDKVKVKLLKSKDYIMMDHNTFVDTYGIEPVRMIDLKGLMGDSSDNIPGVKGIGEKTAIKLLKEYGTVNNLYDHIDEVKGAVHDKLVNDKESAFKSLRLATIFKEVPINIKLDDVKYDDTVNDELVNIYKELEFNSFIKKISVKKNYNKKIDVKIIKDVSEIEIIDEDVAVYIDGFNNYHLLANIKGMAIYGKKTSIFIPGDLINEYVILRAGNNTIPGDKIKDLSFIKGNIYTYNAKKLYVTFRNKNYIIKNIVDDIMIGAYLLNYNVNNDIAYLANDMGSDIPYDDDYDCPYETFEDMAKYYINCAKFIYETKDVINKRMMDEGVYSLYKDVELPLTFVLGDMEYNGIKCDASILDDMGKDIQNRVDEIVKSIYDLCGCEFNIGSPKQLGEVLFDKLKLPHGKKGKSGNYSTDESTLLKLSEYPVISLILEYRMLTKLHSTYIVGLKNNIMEDGRIHTIYTQTLTRTGRLSSIEPNLQNIPIRNEYGRLIRKSFVSDEDSVLLSSDYSQIELRMFSHLADIDSMKQAFINDMDIHAKTASDVYHVDIKDVTKDMRRCAKAVNFGIIYGISSFGLASDLGISVKEARQFRDNYFETYPGIKTYMEKEIEKVHKDGFVKTIMNRKRIISEINDSNYMIRSRGERMALNTPIQGSAADILKKAMVDIDKEFKKKKLKSKMLLQIHDELIFNVIKDEEDIVSKIVKDKMENVFKLSVPLKVEISIGNNLYEAK